MDYIISDLDQKYKESLQDNNQRSFLLKVVDYANYVEKHEETAKLVKKLLTQSQEDLEEYLTQEEEFTRKFKLLAQDLLEIAEKIGVQDPYDHPLKENNIQLLNEFLSEDTPRDYFYGDIGNYFGNYVQLLRDIKDKAEEGVLDNHLLENGDLVLGYEFFLLDKQWKLYKEIRKSQTWWAHYQIQRLQYGVTRREEENPYFNNDFIVDQLYQHEFNQIGTNGSYKPIHLKIDDYKIYLERLNKYLISRLRNYEKETEINDTSTRKGLEIKWDILQAINTPYEAYGHPDSVLVPTVNLRTNKNRDIDIIENVLDGLIKKDLFESYSMKERHYDIQSIEHEKFREYYHTVETRYKEMAKNYQSQNEAKTGKNNRIIEHKGIKYDKGKGEISYRDGSPQDASPEIREMKFFRKLWSSKGEAVPYKDIAKACQTEFYLSEIADGMDHDQLENKDFAEHAKYLKRDFKKFMLNLGMDDDNFRELIKNVRNVGYYLTD